MRGRGGEEADGLGEGGLEGPAEGGVLEAVAWEDLAVGEEGGEEPGEGWLAPVHVKGYGEGESRRGGKLLVGEANVSGAEGPAQVGRVKDVAEREDAPDHGVVESGTDAMSDMYSTGLVYLVGTHTLTWLETTARQLPCVFESRSRARSSHQSGARAVALRDLYARLECRETSKDPSLQPG